MKFEGITVESFICTCNKCGGKNTELCFEISSPYSDTQDYLIGIKCHDCGNKEVVACNDDPMLKYFMLAK